MSKIFVIGLSKTATNSVVDALKHFDYNLSHYPAKDLTAVLEQFDGMADLPTVRFYKDLDKQFPGSKFIWTIRDKDEWMVSVEKHFKRRPVSTLSEWGQENRLAIYGSLYFNSEKFSKVFDEHKKDIEKYFKDRKDDLLTLSVCAGEGWPELMKFLDLDYNPPTIEFPHSNKAPSKTGTIDAVYPYAPDKDDWDELKYSIRSIEQNFLELRNIWIVGQKPDWANDKLKVIEVGGNPGHIIEKERRRNRDFCHKMFLASVYPEISENFLYVADDHYILVPWTSNDFFTRDQLVRENMDDFPADVRGNKHKGLDVETGWQHAIWNTFDKLKAEKELNVWSYETHTPKILNKRRLAHTFGLFGYQKGDLIWQTAYFNLYPVIGGGNLSEVSTKKAGFYKNNRKDDIATARARARDAIFLNHDDDGLTYKVKRVISELFPEPSSYER